MCLLKYGFRLLLAIFVCCSYTDAKSWPCPLETDIAPCLCSSDSSYDLDLNCNAVESDSDLRNALSPAMPFNDYRVISIAKDGTGTNLQELKSDSFLNVNFKNVDIHGTSLERVSDGAFWTSESTLTDLKLDHNRINFFDFEVLPGFTALVSLNMSHNNLTKIGKIESDYITSLDFSFNPGATIDAQTFIGSNALTHLALSGIGLEEVPADIFIGNPLIELRLSRNLLTTLKKNAINPSESSLQKLYLDFNEITQIEVDSIQNLNKNGYLYMNNNKIEELLQSNWEYVFTTLTLENSIDLSGNNLACGCDMLWLFEDTMLVNKLTDSTTCFDNSQTNAHSPDDIHNLCRIYQ